MVLRPLRRVALRAPEIARRLLLVLLLALASVGASAQGPPGAEVAAGDWTGSYVCAQGETGLDLRLRPQGDGRLAGLFHFYPLSGNPAAEEGCYEVQAVPQAGSLWISAGRWLLRPDNYVTVDLLGELDEDGTLHGLVAGPGCESFALRRSPAPRPIPTACGAVISAHP